VKQTAAKGREVRLQVHHRDGINWDGVVDAVIRAMLPDPSRLEALCERCHAGEAHAGAGNAGAPNTMNGNGEG
jgi:hypothetical protein